MVSFDNNVIYFLVIRMQVKIGAASHYICEVMDKYGVCQNGGQCAMTNPDRLLYQFCECPTGYHGFLCETQGTLQAPQSMLVLSQADDL